MENNNSILKEALINYRELKEAAEKAATKKLSQEFPNKFNEFLNEEIKKIEHNNSDNLEEKQESEKLEEGVENKNNEDMKSKKDVEKKEGVDTTEKKEVNEGTENKKTDNKKKVNESYEEFDPVDAKKMEIDDVLGDYDLPSDDEVGPGSETGFEFDEFTMEDIEREISEMEKLESELQESRDKDWTHKDSSSPTFGDKSGIAFKEKLRGIKNSINELLGETEGDDMEEPVLDENEEVLTDEDINEVLKELSEEEIDEQHGVTHAINKYNMPGRKHPRSDYATYKKERRPDHVNEETDKKTKSLIEANKKTTKSLNETRRKLKAVGGLVEGYKTALEKYRDQLKAMSVFNTNLAHVNNILINEELALTKEDKVKIINEFKKIDTIENSEAKYKEVLSEMKSTKKKPIKENLDEKFSKSSSIQNSSKKALDEVIEKTAYENDSQLAKIKRLSEYIENRGKKI